MFNFRRWLRSRSSAGNRTDRKHQPPRTRLEVELLETRALPAVTYVPAAAVVPANRTDVALGTFNNFEEPNLTINSRFDPGNIAISSHDNMIISVDAYANTTTPAGTGATYPAANFGDTWADYDSQNRLFWTNLDGTGTNGVSVTQVNPTTGAAVAPGAVVVNTPAAFDSDDRQALAVDDNPSSPFRDNVYVIWTRFDQMAGPDMMLGNADDVTLTRVFVSRSTNQGVMWSAPVLIGQSEGVDGILGNADDENFVQQVFISVAQNGDVIASYHSQVGFAAGTARPVPDGVSGQMIVARSTNGGVTFTRTATQPFGPGQADITFNRRTTADTTGIIPGTQFLTQGSVSPYVYEDPNNANTLYAFTVDDPNNMHGVGDDADLVFARSTNGGATWTQTTLVADPAGGAANSFQLFPTAAIDRFGTLVVGFYSNERGLTNNGPDGIAGNADDRFLLDFFVMYSVDGGLTWTTPFRVNDTAFNPDAPNTVLFRAAPETTTRIGEYFGLDVFAGTAYVTWIGNGASPPSQQLMFDAIPIQGALTITGDDGAVVTNDDIVLRRVPTNTDYVEVRVNGQRQYFGLFSALTSITVNSLAGNDTFTVDFANGNPIPAGGIQYNAATNGGDTLATTNSAVGQINTWNINAVNGGNLGVSTGGTITFADTENLTGNGQQDIFRFTGAGSIAGQANGGGGLSDWLDYSAIAASIQANLAAGTASRTGSIAGIEHVLGSSVGGDTLTGNAAANILVGKGANNTILGNDGRDFIIGGFGKNFLDGGADDDLIVAGRTNFDANIIALQAILAEWTSGNNYNTRVTNIRTGGGLTAGFLLVANTTLYSAPAGPRFGRGGGTGQSTVFGRGGQDYFLVVNTSIVVDFDPNTETFN